MQIFPREFDEPCPTWALTHASLAGRRRGLAVQLDDASVSREHARIEIRSSDLLIRDLGSRHGTFVDGQRVGESGVAAADGSIVRMGGTLLLVSSDVARYAAPLKRLAREFLGVAHDVLAGPTLLEAWQEASRVAALSHPVLVIGESGTGKEAVARLLHAARARPGPFVALNVAAIPHGLFEAELFGHARGAFTGAIAARPGAFREASGGVLFLDEVGDLQQALQVKVLRAIDQMRVRPLGSESEIPVQPRVVAATSRDLAEACANGSFRSDLYYRLAGIEIRVPPLRERRDEIVALAIATLRGEETEIELTAETAERLVLASWEGNVRQLRHAVVQASIRALSAGRRHLLPVDLPASKATETMQERIEAAMVEASGNASFAARSLGISRATLYTLFKRYQLDPAAIRAKV